MPGVNPKKNRHKPLQTHQTFQDGVEVKFHQLDINNKESIEKLANFLKETYGGLDVLVNNAGVMFPDDCELPGAPEVLLQVTC